MMTEISKKQLLEVAEKAAKEAGAFIRKQSQSELVINEASRNDIKIQLDVDSQKKIELIILEHFPEHSILGEEGGEGNQGEGYEWIVDPIDGTVNLVYDIPHFCVSIACRNNEETLIGVVYDPMRDECFSGVKGEGASCNGKKIQVSNRSQIEEAIISIGFSKSPENRERSLALVQFYSSQVRKMRAMGSAALDLVYVAAGRFDAYIEQGIRIWDIAAGQLILEEAGGKVELVPRDGPHCYRIKAWNGRIDFEKS